MLDLVEEGNYFAVRPSGTEPKVKFYMFSYCSPAESSDLPAAKKNASVNAWQPSRPTFAPMSKL